MNILKSENKLFIAPTIISIILLAGVWIYLGFGAFLTALLLVALEITLSFDNAVVNAKVLERMSPWWQQVFITWGIIIAVVGTRIVLPILIVAVSVGTNPVDVLNLAIFSPEEYGHLLEGAHHAISAFGGMFLLMVSLKYFFDTHKEVHWIQSVERYIARWGRIEAVEMSVSLIILLIASRLVPEEAATILAAGMLGLIVFIVMQGMTSTFSERTAGQAAASGLSLFLYLEVLDTAFSLDGVIGAFAITNVLPIIIIGLGIGAYFVRTLTIYLVRAKTLSHLMYVEHGAHWAILGLALCMIISLVYDIPEVVTGLIGLVFIVTSVYSSIGKRRTQPVYEG